jgi:undecaprenyl-diphosphatase
MPTVPRPDCAWWRSDSGWCLRANHAAERALVRHGFAVVSRLGDGVFWYVLMAAMIILDGRDGVLASAHLAITGVTALTVYRWLKRWARRPRPFAADGRIRAWVAPLDEFSFPSGHTLHAVAFTIVALVHYPGLAWLLVPFTGLVGASRVVLGLHYPSDVIAATAIGGMLAALSIWISMPLV